MGTDKIIQLAKKLKALAERGIGGEKINAQNMLDKLLMENDLTIEQINEPDRKDHFFEYKFKQRDILVQVIRSIMGNKSIYTVTGKKTVICISCDNAEYIEIQAAFNVFWKAYEKELDLFLVAFVSKNKLFAAGPSDNDKPSTLTEIEKYKIAKMSEGIDKYTNHKLLT